MNVMVPVHIGLSLNCHVQCTCTSLMLSFLSSVLSLSVRLHFETCSSTVGANSTTSSRLACLKREERVERTPWSNVIPCMVLPVEDKIAKSIIIMEYRMYV